MSAWPVDASERAGAASSIRRACARPSCDCSGGMRPPRSPRCAARPVTGHDMVERQVVAALAAVLAGVIVALEDFLARELYDRTRALHVIRESDDRGRREPKALARHDMAVLLDDGRLVLGEQDDSAPHVTHVQRLVVEVQDQDIRVDDRHVQILGAERYDGARMTSSANGSNGTGKTGTWTVKTGLAQMLKGGVIMDVVTADHARIAEEAGAVAVMALERVPADIRATVASRACPTPR